MSFLNHVKRSARRAMSLKKTVLSASAQQNTIFKSYEAQCSFLYHKPWVLNRGEIPHQGGILYLEFCLRCNVVKACNIAASRSVSLLTVFVQWQCSVSAFRNSRHV